MLWSIGVIIFLLLIITGFLGSHESSLILLNISNQIFFQMSFSIPIILFSNSQDSQDSSFSKDEDFTSNDKDSTSNDKDSISNDKESNYSTKERKEIKYWLTKYNIKPVLIFESLHKEGIKEKIKLETRKKAGIYAIFNLITGDYYIGSAISNRFYYRFYKHLIKGLGNKHVYNSVNLYKLENFAFVILEIFPEEVTRKNNKDLMELETKWLKTYFPPFNTLLESGNPETYYSQNYNFYMTDKRK